MSTSSHELSPSAGRYDLGSLLACDECDRPLQPSRDESGQRVYLFLCGCQRRTVNAETVERLARDRVEAESPVLAADLAMKALGPVFQRLFTGVRIGADLNDLAFVWRI